MRVNKYNELNSTQNSKIPSKKSLLKLKQGEIFKAQIIDIQQGKAILRLNDGMSIEARLQNELLEMKIGESMFFKVKSNSNEQILIETFKHQNQNPKLNIILEALDSAHLLASSDNVKMVEKLLDNNLPIDSNNLQEVFLKLKMHPNLKLEELIFLLNNEIPVNKENINQLKSYVLNNLSLAEQIDELINEINNIKDNNLKLDILNTYDDSNSSQFIPLQKEIKSLIYIYDNYEFLTDHLNNDENNLNNILDLVDNEIRSTLLEDKEVLIFFKEHIKQFMLNNQDKNHLESIISGKFKDFLKMIQKDINIPLEQLKEQKNLDESLNKIYNFAKRMENMENDLELSEGNDIINASKQIKNNLDFMNELNKYDSYIQIPINMDNNTTKADIYVFRRNKNKKNNSHSISAFIALDLKNLGHLEAFIQKNYKDISCQFRLENEAYKNIIQTHIHKLINSLSNKGYNLKSITFKKLEEKFNILQSPEKNSNLKEEIKRYSFDMRV